MRSRRPERHTEGLAPELAALAHQVSEGSRPQTMSESVRSTLRRAILNGDLPGGTRLGLADVGAALGVSVTPVREALRRLAAEGFVELGPYQGGIVRSLERAEIEEVVRIRHILEPHAIAEAVEGMTDDILERAESFLRRMEEHPHDDRWVDWNRFFHDTLYEGARSRRLIAMLAELQDPVLMYVSAAAIKIEDFRDEANVQHRAIIEAMRAGDKDAVVSLTLQHVALPIRATEGQDGE